MIRMLGIFCVILLLSGCVTTGQYQSKSYSDYIAQARLAADNYYFDDNDCLGFKVGGNINDYLHNPEYLYLDEVTNDPASSATIYLFDDPNANFSLIHVYADQNNRIVKIFALRSPRARIKKEYTSTPYQLFSSIDDKFEEKYKAVEWAGADGAYLRSIRAKNSREEWIDGYANYLKEQDGKGYTLSWDKYTYIIHPNLKNITILMDGYTKVSLKYTTVWYEQLQVENEEKIKDSIEL